MYCYSCRPDSMKYPDCVICDCVIGTTKDGKAAGVTFDGDMYCHGCNGERAIMQIADDEQELADNQVNPQRVAMGKKSNYSKQGSDMCWCGSKAEVAGLCWDCKEAI